MTSPEEAAERAIFDDAEMSGSDGSDDTDSDNSDAELPSASAAAAPRIPCAVEEVSPADDPVEVVPVQSIQNGDSGLKVEDLTAISALPAVAAASDSVPRLFQKLWTDEDELIILQGFYEFTSSRGTTHADYQYDTGPFYDQIKARLQLDFTKNQLIEKLRRLKKKYRTAVTRIDQGRAAVFKSPHDRAAFDISRKIWSPVFKRPREINEDGENVIVDAPADRRSARRRRVKSEQIILSSPMKLASVPIVDQNHAATAEVLPAALTPPTVPLTQISPLVATQPAPVAQVSVLSTPPARAVSIIEETVQCCLSPLLKELIQSAMGPWPAMAMAEGLLTPLGFGGAFPDGEKWRKQQIMELEVWTKRLELVQEEVKLRLVELRSSTTATANGSS